MNRKIIKLAGIIIAQSRDHTSTQREGGVQV
nr:MAG TPA: hypothetical protein [Caudoviricetes sp.]